MVTEPSVFLFSSFVFAHATPPQPTNQPNLTSPAARRLASPRFSSIASIQYGAAPRGNQAGGGGKGGAFSWFVLGHGQVTIESAWPTPQSYLAHSSSFFGILLFPSLSLSWFWFLTLRWCGWGGCHFGHQGGEDETGRFITWSGFSAGVRSDKTHKTGRAEAARGRNRRAAVGLGVEGRGGRCDAGLDYANGTAGTYGYRYVCAVCVRPTLGGRCVRRTQCEGGGGDIEGTVWWAGSELGSALQNTRLPRQRWRGWCQPVIT